MLKKPSFRTAFARGRCLIPASGWYEWLRAKGGGKQPYNLKLKEDEPFAFAGLFDVWRGEGAEHVVSCTVLTTAATEGLAWLHDRMPVILDYDHYDRWLERSTPDIADLTELLQPYPVDELVVHPVSPLVNRTGKDERALLEALSA